MSIAIHKLHKDEREVGKTIKGTKKYYVWEFVLNNKFHKIEIFHSKVTGKKKLCLDAQQLIADQGYQSSFTFSFKIDKHYFNIVQISLDKFELKIDNKLFENLILDERSGRLKPTSVPSVQPNKQETNFKPKYQEPKYQEPIPEYLRSYDSDKRNDDNFYDSDDNDFDFAGGKSNLNSFAFKKEEAPKIETKKSQGNALLDFNDIAEIKKVQQSHGKTNSQTQNMVYGGSNQQSKPETSTNTYTFQHNQNIFNNINLFGEEKKQNDNLMVDNMFGGNANNQGNTNTMNNNQMGFLNISNQNQSVPNNNFGNIPFDMVKNQNQNLNQNQNQNLNQNQNQNQNMMGMNMSPFGAENSSNQMTFGNNNTSQNMPNNANINTNTSINMNMGFGEIQSNNNFNQFNQQPIAMQPYLNMNDNNNYSPMPLNQPQYQSPSLDFNNPQMKESSPYTHLNENPQNTINQQQYQPFQNSSQDNQPQEPKNDFKSKLLSSGLVDIDNLLSNKNNPKNQNSNYNFSIQQTNQFGDSLFGEHHQGNSNLNLNYGSLQKETNKSSTPFDF